MKLKIYFAPLWFILAITCFHMFQKTDDLWWTLGASGFAIASIRSSLLFIRDIIQESKRQ
jgi:hypothetical protein